MLTTVNVLERRVGDLEQIQALSTKIEYLAQLTTPADETPVDENKHLEQFQTLESYVGHLEGRLREVENEVARMRARQR